MPRDRAESMRVLYGQHAGPLWRYAMSLTGDRVRAEEVVEQTLLRAWRRPRLRDGDVAAVRGRLLGITRGLAVDPGHAAPTPDAESGPVPLRGDAAGEPPPDLLPRLLARTRPKRHWGRAAAVGIGMVAAAAAVVTVVSLLPPPMSGPSANIPRGPSAPVTAQPMVVVPPAAMTADVSVIGREWGTRIDVVGRYPAPPGGGYGTERSAYEMVLTDHTGARTVLATWTAVAGETVTPSGTTSMPMLWINRVDVRSVAADRVLLTATF